MKKFVNVSKKKNNELQKHYSHFLKSYDDCTPSEFKTFAISVFDHWLFKTDSFGIIENATNSQKKAWTKQVHDLLRQLTATERPIYFKLNGKHTKPRLQFRDYIGSKPISQFICEQYDEIYEPNCLFESASFKVAFEDNWTITVFYHDIDKLEPLIRTVAKNKMFLLPSELLGDLNQYDEVKQKLISMRLDELLTTLPTSSN